LKFNNEQVAEMTNTQLIEDTKGAAKKNASSQLTENTMRGQQLQVAMNTA
jgi:hypothetical protein